MFIVPASKVSVPLTVVMRTWVKVSDRVLLPPLVPACVEPVIPYALDNTQVLPETSVKTAWPNTALAAVATVRTYPDVELNPVDVAASLATTEVET